MLQTTTQVSFSAVRKLECIQAVRRPPVGQSFLLHRKSHQLEKENTCDRHKGLCPHVVKAMIRAAKKVGRHGIRDGAIILLMFRHGLRTAELVALK